MNKKLREDNKNFRDAVIMAIAVPIILAFLAWVFTHNPYVYGG